MALFYPFYLIHPLFSFFFVLTLVTFFFFDKKHLFDPLTFFFFEILCVPFLPFLFIFYSVYHVYLSYLSFLFEKHFLNLFNPLLKPFVLPLVLNFFLKKKTLCLKPFFHTSYSFHLLLVLLLFNFFCVTLLNFLPFLPLLFFGFLFEKPRPFFYFFKPFLPFLLLLTIFYPSYFSTCSYHFYCVFVNIFTLLIRYLFLFLFPYPYTSPSPFSLSSFSPCLQWMISPPLGSW